MVVNDVKSESGQLVKEKKKWRSGKIFEAAESAKDIKANSKFGLRDEKDSYICIYIYFRKAHHLVMKMTQLQMASKTQCMLYLPKAGVKGFQILYWLSSCDDKDKDKILCNVGAECFTRVIY